jgi:hypothetical protein
MERYYLGNTRASCKSYAKIHGIRQKDGAIPSLETCIETRDPVGTG